MFWRGEREEKKIKKKTLKRKRKKKKEREAMMVDRAGKMVAAKERRERKNTFLFSLIRSCNDVIMENGGNSNIVNVCQ